jgi:hypothetical protein
VDFLHVTRGYVAAVHLVQLLRRNQELVEREILE